MNYSLSLSLVLPFSLFTWTLHSFCHPCKLEIRIILKNWSVTLWLCIVQLMLFSDGPNWFGGALRILGGALEVCKIVPLYPPLCMPLKSDSNEAIPNMKIHINQRSNVNITYILMQFYCRSWLRLDLLFLVSTLSTAIARSSLDLQVSLPPVSLVMQQAARTHQRRVY